MGGLARQGDARPLAIEARPPLDELEGARRPFLDQHADRPLVAQTVARLDRVLIVQRNLVVVRQHRGQTALRLVRGRIGRTVLGQDRDAPAAPGDLDGGAQAGDSAPGDDHVEGRASVAHAPRSLDRFASG